METSLRQHKKMSNVYWVFLDKKFQFTARLKISNMNTLLNPLLLSVPNLRKYVLYLLKYRFAVYFSRCSTDLR